MKKKRRLNRWVLVSLIILGILGLLWLAFVSLMANPKYVITESVARTFEVLTKDNGKETGASGFQFGTTITLGGSILDDSISDNSFKVRGLWDLENDVFQVSASVLESKNKILDGTYLYSKGKEYVASDNLFTNVYNIDNYDCTDKDDLICFLQTKDEEIKNSLEIDTSKVSIDAAISELREATITSVNGTNTFRNKGSFKDELKDYNKYTYSLDKDTLSSIYNKLGDSAKYYLYDIVCLMDNDCDDLAIGKERLEEKLKNWNDVFEINIYTDGLFNKFKALELGNNSTFVNFYYNKETKKLSASLPEKKVKVEMSSPDDRVLTTIYYKDVLLGTIDYQDKEKERNWNYKFNFLGLTISGTVDDKFNRYDDYTDGVVDMDTSINALFIKTDLNLNFDYNFSEKISVSSLDVSKALDYNEMTDDDKSQMVKGLEEFKKSNIGKIFGLFDEEDVIDNSFNDEV